MNRTVIQLGMAASLVVASFTSDLSAQTQLSEQEVQLATEASQRVAQREAAKLLLFASLITFESGEVVEVSRDVRIKYHSALALTVAPIPLTSSGAGFVYLAKESFDEIKFVFESLNQLFEPIRRLGAAALRSSAEFLDNAIFHASFEFSGNVADFVVNLLRPIAKSIFAEGMRYFSGASFLGSSLSGMSFVIFQDTEQVLDWKQARWLLGYDESVKSRLDTLLADLGAVYNLNSRNREVLRDLLKEELVRQAAENDFSDEASYEIDVINLMANEGMISNDLVIVTRSLQAMYAKASSYRHSDVAGLEALVKDLETMALMGAVIEEYLNQGILNDERAKEAQMILGNLHRTMDLVKNNFM